MSVIFRSKTWGCHPEKDTHRKASTSSFRSAIILVAGQHAPAGLSMLSTSQLFSGLIPGAVNLRKARTATPPRLAARGLRSYRWRWPACSGMTMCAINISVFSGLIPGAVTLEKGVHRKASSTSSFRSSMVSLALASMPRQDYVCGQHLIYFRV